MEKKSIKHYLKTILTFNLLSFVLVFFILKFGLFLSVKISEIFQNKKTVGGDIQSETYLPPPRFSGIIEATSSAQLSVSGYSSANQEVQIYLNNDLLKTISVNSEGMFESGVTLVRGTNIITAAAKDKNGTLSSFSPEISVFYSDTPPSLEISDPVDGKLFRGNNFITISGKTDKINKVYINEHLAILDGNGFFNYQVKLNTGDNNFVIVCLDPAQNKTEKELMLRFRP